MALTQVSDIVTPEIFTPYMQQETEDKTRLIQAGVLVRSPLIDSLLAGGGLTFNVPSFQALTTAASNVSGDNAADVQTLAAGAGTTLAAQNDSRPLNNATSTEVATRMSRNQSWSTADLSAALAGSDPMASILGGVSSWWARNLQSQFVRTIQGIIADNTANDAADYTRDISGGGFIDGVTNLSAEAVIDATLTMGDSMEDLEVIMVHPVVMARMKKNNLIDFIPDSRGETNIPTYEGMEVIVDSGLPNTGGVYESWLFANGAVQLGVSTPKVGTEVHRDPLAGNGGGQETLTTRVEWSIHPTGHAYATTPGSGGPTDAQLVLAANWDRVYPDRRQIKFARLVTRESA